MRVLLLIIVVMALTSCTSSQQYNEKVERIITYSLDDSLYKLTKEHLICYRCETDSYPASVTDLIKFKSTTEECKGLFKGREFDFIDQQVNDFMITVKQWKSRTIYVFTMEGLNFEEVNETKASTRITMVVYDSELTCPHNKSKHLDLGKLSPFLHSQKSRQLTQAGV